MNRTLRVTLSHPYTYEQNANEFREMRHLIKEPLEATWTMHMRR
jgi:hypothetical protein